MHLANHTAVITGGCSGLGLAVAEAFFNAGANLVLIDLNATAGTEKQAIFGNERALFVQADVTSEQAIAQAFDSAVAKFGQVHFCVNCAGVAPAERLLNRDGSPASLAKFNQTLAINLSGTFNVARLAAAKMALNAPDPATSERGVIINTASIAGYEGQIGQTAYAASKAGIIGLTLPMARDLAALGIRVNSVAPGVMGTPLLTAMPQEVQDALGATVPFPKRLGLPAEFASLVMHICENSYINGETLRLDGALRMPPR
ncbi:SDR family oxidoreductase [Alteromonas lipolytica]|uniref:3-hydroxy-2-methylbutyryl-CoA dehydrogenase n=1 Tax=Alteromonas lipolytica TaxID=1856405 RepID=A0A1E8FGF4_9ALTE|nr:SDR family oxidoreductase [Alteromonas lipolytica]OFI35037.1 3-hydroxy-2-methylbutyryl-CoA dehydrogenase [Alteromonas lipolytica]GGF56088.1 3-hydroxyacyl-CoA dehydrogenase [Alteromonas lipolytica]